jgi:predicted metal-binding membrane protein
MRDGNRAATVAVLATLGVAAAAWVVSIRQMSGMQVGSRVGSFGSFVTLWGTMMAAMMLPGAAPAVVRQAGARLTDVPLFLGSYLALWTLLGVAVYAVYRPAGSLTAGMAAVAAGVYELTPLKQRFRRGCQDSHRSGFGFGLNCVGSSMGLMLMLLALGLMSLTWMFLIAVLVLAQKLLPPNPIVDVPVGLVILGLGVVIVLAPSSVPGFMPAM